MRLVEREREKRERIKSMDEVCGERDRGESDIGEKLWTEV